MFGTIVFLVAARLFVAQNPSVAVIVDGATGYNGGLPVFAHDLPIQVERGGFLPDQFFLPDEPLQIFFRFIVDGSAMGIGFRRTIDFRANDMEEGIGISGRHFKSLFPVHDVIGEGGNGGSVFRGRAKS